MADKYNGWTNYETWNVALWIDNDQCLQESANNMAEQCFKDAWRADGVLDRKERAGITMADQLKSDHEEGVPELQGCYADLLSAALSEVNWYEIARHYIDEMDLSEYEAEEKQA